MYPLNKKKTLEMYEINQICNKYIHLILLGIGAFLLVYLFLF